MHYLFTPPHTHVDFGFGVTGDAFYEAADKLEKGLSERNGVFCEQIPINFLRRHAIELFIKSAIAIIHNRIELPYGSFPCSGEPHALVNEKWVPFKRIHSVKFLWMYLSALFQEHKLYFNSISRVDWTFPSEIDEWVKKIEMMDPRSTFFRYPDPGNTALDIPKAVMKEASTEELADRLKASKDGQREFMFILEDQVGEIAGGYYYQADALSDINSVLKECASIFYGLHAAIRLEICGGA